ncbi:hypothetical protein ACFQ9J_25245 [Streptomyces sp. NPDC056529]|uniref:hypothetical protein n=1 Tax=Streptomyces sp. NPDC056529 TaxID=3345855 RepID=UPI0036BD9AF6
MYLALDRDHEHTLAAVEQLAVGEELTAHSGGSGDAQDVARLIRNGLGSGSLVGDARHLSPSTQETLRLRAVAALMARWGREDMTAAFGVSLKAVDIWWAKWQAGGREVLVMRPCGKRSSTTGPLTWA